MNMPPGWYPAPSGDPSLMSWGIYKGTRANTVAFGVCNLLFMNTIFFGGGLPVSNKER